MGLLKKKSEEIVVPVETEDQAAAPSPEPEDDGAELTEALFAAPADTPDDGGEADEDAPEPALDDPAPPAPVQTVEVKEEGADSLLNVFESMQSEIEDRSILLELVGEVDVASLSEELRTTAAALGIVRARKRADDAA